MDPLLFLGLWSFILVGIAGLVLAARIQPHPEHEQDEHVAGHG